VETSLVSGSTTDTPSGAKRLEIEPLLGSASEPLQAARKPRGKQARESLGVEKCMEGEFRGFTLSGQGGRLKRRGVGEGEAI
jgi:hypothetical protein